MSRPVRGVASWLSQSIVPYRPGFSTTWPHVVIEYHDAETARMLVLHLLAAMDGRSVRSMAREAGLDEKTLRKIIAGLSWPDLRSIARLEEATGRKLFPR